MSISWEKDFDQTVLANKLSEVSLRVAQGSASFDDANLSVQIRAVIRSAVSFDEFDITEADQFRIVNSAVSTAASLNQLTPNGILAEISNQTKHFTSLPKKKYTLLTNLVADNSSDLSTVRISGHTITFSKERPIKFDWPEARRLQIHQIVGHQLPPNLLVVRVSGEGRSEIEAADKALDALDFLRGIWNFTINWKRHPRWSSSPNQPINKIRLGPIHSLHDRGGNLATDEKAYWYESDFGPVQEVFLFTSVDWGKIKETEGWIRKKIANHRYGKEVAKAYIRYTRSLDSRDLYATYLSLWGVLEFLTSTEFGRYDDTIRRTSFMSHRDERDYHYQVLKHLRKFRNRRVHADVDNSEIETLAFQLKGYVEALIDFHLNNRFRFNSISDVGEFLQLSYELKDINDGIDAAKNKIQRLKHARKFRYGI